MRLSANKPLAQSQTLPPALSRKLLDLHSTAMIILIYRIITKMIEHYSILVIKVKQFAHQAKYAVPSQVFYPLKKTLCRGVFIVRRADAAQLLDELSFFWLI